MDLPDYVEEAAAALGVPRDHWLILRNITYDPLNREWEANCLHIKSAAFSVDPHIWILKIIGWLQYNYPEGPVFPESSCC